MATARFLTINRQGKLQVEFRDDSFAVLTGTAEEQLAAIDEAAPDGCACSSAIDFPHDFTTDPEVLRACEILAGPYASYDAEPDRCESCGLPGTEANPVTARLCSPYDGDVSHVHKACGAAMARSLVL